MNLNLICESQGGTVTLGSMGASSSLGDGGPWGTIIVCIVIATIFSLLLPYNDKPVYEVKGDYLVKVSGSRKPGEKIISNMDEASDEIKKLDQAKLEKLLSELEVEPKIRVSDFMDLSKHNDPIYGHGDIDLVVLGSVVFSIILIYFIIEMIVYIIDAKYFNGEFFGLNKIKISVANNKSVDNIIEQKENNLEKTTSKKNTKTIFQIVKDYITKKFVL